MPFFRPEAVRDEAMARMRTTVECLKCDLDFLRHQCYDVVAEAETGTRTKQSARDMIAKLERRIAGVEARRNALDDLVRGEFWHALDVRGGLRVCVY